MTPLMKKMEAIRPKRLLLYRAIFKAHLHANVRVCSYGMRNWGCAELRNVRDWSWLHSADSVVFYCANLFGVSCFRSYGIVKILCIKWDFAIPSQRDDIELV